MTKEELRAVEWMVERAEMRIGGMLLMFAGRPRLGIAVFFLPSGIDWLKEYLIARRLRKEAGASC